MVIFTVETHLNHDIKMLTVAAMFHWDFSFIIDEEDSQRRFETIQGAKAYLDNKIKNQDFNKKLNNVINEN